MMTMPFCYIPDLLTGKGSLEACLKKVSQAGGPGKVGLRFLLQRLWGDGQEPKNMPYLQAITPNGNMVWFTHETLHKKFPVFDLRKKNIRWWKKLQEIDGLCLKLRIYSCPSIHDYRNPDKNTKYFYPFKCSLQGLGGDNIDFVTPKEAKSMFLVNRDGIYGERLKQWHFNFANDVIKFMKSNLFAEAANEFSRLTWKVTSKVPLEWHRWFADAIYHDLPKLNRVVISGLADDKMKSLYHFSHHGVGNLATYKNVQFVSKTKAIVSADGFRKGAGPADAAGGRGSSVAEAKEVAQAGKKDRVYAVETMYRAFYVPDKDNADLDRFNPDTLEAVAKILNV